MWNAGKAEIETTRARTTEAAVNIGTFNSNNLPNVVDSGQ